MRRSLRNEIAQAEHRLRRGMLFAMLFSLFIWPGIVRPALYDETYTGPRWRYGLEHRPLSNYFNLSFPDPILFSDRPDPRFPYHGTAEWPCEIPEGEARHHSLVLVSAPDEEWGPDSAQQLLERGPA